MKRIIKSDPRPTENKKKLIKKKYQPVRFEPGLELKKILCGLVIPLATTRANSNR